MECLHSEENLKKRITTIIIWIVLFAAIVMMVSGMNPSRTKADELDYNTEFLQLVERTVSGESGKTIKAIPVHSLATEYNLKPLLLKYSQTIF